MPQPDPMPADTRTPQMAWVHALGALSVTGLLALAAVSSTHLAPPTRLPLYFTAWTLLWIACLRVGFWITPSSTPSPLLRTILIWGALLRVIAFLSPPVMEDDYFRYLWDGRQMVTTGNPYAHTPSHFFEDPHLGPAFDSILERVNYPHVPTIYAPVLQYAFGLSYLISPASLWPWKLILLAADLLLAYNLWRSQHLRALAWYAWCPLLLQENGMTAHPDLLGAMFVTLAFFLRSSQSGLWTGIALGFAAATKITGLLFVPFLLPSLQFWRGHLSFLATVALLYSPFWIQGSTADWAGLSQFAQEWEFNSAGFALLHSWLGPHLGRFEALSLTASGLLFLWWTQRHLSHPRFDIALGWFFLWSAVIQPWYLLWTLPWIFLRPSFTGFTALIVVSLSYIIPLHSGQPSHDLYLHPPWVRPLEFGLIFIALLFDLLRHRSQTFLNRTPVLS